MKLDRLKPWVLSLGLLVTGCGGSAYVDAAGVFASAASTSTPTLQGAVAFNHHLCRRRAQLNYLQNRLMGTNTVDGSLSGQAIYWEDFYTKFSLGGTAPTFEAQCKALGASDAAVGKALNAISAYAAALNTVAGEDYSGTDIGGLVSDVSGLLGTIPSVPGAATNAVKALGPTATGPGPIGQLAGALKKSYASGRIKDIVMESDPAVTTLLGIVSQYLSAVSAEETEWEKDVVGTVDTIDRRLSEKVDAPQAHPIVEALPLKAETLAAGAKGKGPAAPPSPVAASLPPAGGLARPDPIQVMDLYRTAESWMHDIELTRTKQSAIADACQQLSQAEQALVKADGDNKSPELTTVLMLVAQVLGDVAQVQAAIQGGASQ